MVTRAFPNIISTDLQATKTWFTDLLDWETEFDSDWFVHLKAKEAPAIELGIIDASHEIAAGVGERRAGGIILTLVVEDVDDVHRRALDLGYDLIEAPRDLFYGQRRMLLREPNGIAVDISSECEPSPAFLDSLA